MAKSRRRSLISATYPVIYDLYSNSVMLMINNVGIFY